MDYKVSKNTASSHLLGDFANCTLQFPLNSLNLNLRQLLQQQLLKSVLSLTMAEIPLYRLKNTSKIVYRSAITLQSSGDRLCPNLSQLIQVLLTESVINQPLLDFQISVVSPGLIDFRLSDRALGVWLQQLPQFSFSASFCQPPPSFNRFPLQYVHARCCSLLHLAHRQGLIVLKDLSSAGWQWYAPESIPFFESAFRRQLP